MFFCTPKLRITPSGGLQKIAELCPTLTRLDLRSVFIPISRITWHPGSEAVIAMIGARCTSLTFLSIAHGIILQPNVFQSTQHRTNTTNTNCTSSNEGQVFFPSLRELDIRGTVIAQSVDAAVPKVESEVLDPLPSLQVLHVSWLPSVLEEARMTIPRLHDVQIFLS